MKVTAVECLKCGCVIYSRARHDMHSCTCKSVYIDGGFDYIKVSGNLEDYVLKHINVKQTKRQLYIDWSTYADKYGLIKPSKKGKKCKK